MPATHGRGSLRDEPSHEEAEESLDGVESGFVREKGLATSCNGPPDHDARDPDVGTKLLADESARKFSREEADQEDLSGIS